MPRLMNAMFMNDMFMCKTAQESQATYPDAAEVLTNNVYMDDICDPVDTVEKAQGQEFRNRLGPGAPTRNSRPVDKTLPRDDGT